MTNQTNGSPSLDALDTEVLVVGAGPTGLTLAAALLTRGIATIVVDRLPVWREHLTRGRWCTRGRSRSSSRST
jgi:2-polyprenyl-6-methoxyphenol hydroxylase-like FAD-dependent oxidoreductase